MSCFVTIIHIYVHETDAKRVLNNRKRFKHCNQHGLLQINVRFHLRIGRGGGKEEEEMEDFVQEYDTHYRPTRAQTRKYVIK